MAQRRSCLASYTPSEALAAAHVPLNPSSATEAPPAASDALESASELPSLSRSRAKSALINYPCRLRQDQVDRLNHLKDTLGVLPAELIRDGVDLALKRVPR